MPRHKINAYSVFNTFTASSDSGYATSGANTGLSGSSAFSIGGWLKFVSSASGYLTLFAMGSGTEIGVILNTGTKKIAFANHGNTIAEIGNFVPSIGSWYHVVMTSAGGVSGAINIYIDGQLIGTTTAITTSYANGKMYIGSIPAWLSASGDS